MISDYIESSLKNIKRNKKNTILIIIFSLLFFLLFVDTFIFKNFFDFYESMYKKSSLLYTLSVDHPTKKPSEAIEELKDIAHVVDIYDSMYGNIGVSSNLNDNGLDGSLGLKYGIKKMVPKSVAGKRADELLPGELACPSSFYPDGSYETILDIDESKFLSKNQTLNREVVLSYWNRLRSPEEEEDIKEREVHTKKMKIVGVYDSRNYKEDFNVCYVGMDDIKEIRDIIYPQEEKNYTMLFVVVDNKKNMKEVRKHIQDKGYGAEMISIFDYAYIGTLFTVVIVTAIVLILSIVFIIKNYLNKRIKNETKYLGILRACGYTKNQVIMKEIIENSLVLLFSFVFSFAFVLILVQFIHYKLINKKLGESVADVLMEE